MVPSASSPRLSFSLLTSSIDTALSEWCTNNTTSWLDALHYSSLPSMVTRRTAFPRFTNSTTCAADSMTPACSHKWRCMSSTPSIGSLATPRSTSFRN
ncbi:hypothetical protein FOTG_19176 [Fusarium oxysporum f. sp. vasinfectum 25433]|uniref:Uncharacterized protein n=1 Tax=Fusarium oxysporum f. sp. vasinfectum 25433 TaxID=1089449 RepID=X0KFR4_FUSOX|nr:hypothetical protein FOTG_19176 [Fusarium oxysporum f. sp. vasinfectum 25433]